METLRDLFVSIEFDNVDMRQLMKIDKLMDNIEDDLRNAGAEMSIFTKETRQMAREAGRAGRDLDDLGREARGIGRDFEDMRSLGGGAFSALRSGASALLATLGGFYILDKIKDGFRDMVQTGIQFNASAEQSLTSWATILESRMEAEDTMSRLRDMAKETPFEFGDLDKAAKYLKMAKFEGDELFKMLNNLGDAVSAIGGDGYTLEGVSMAMFQMYTKSKVQAEEMNQLAERGIPAWELMAQGMGKSSKELMKMAENGELFAEKALPAMLDQMGKKFRGSMQEQNKTFNGQLSVMRDNYKLLMGTMSEPLFEELKKDMPYINRTLEYTQTKFEKEGWRGALDAILPDGWADRVVEFGKLVSENWGDIKKVFTDNEKEFDEFGTAFGELFDSAMEFSKQFKVTFGESFGEMATSNLKSFLDTATEISKALGWVLDKMTAIMNSDFGQYLNSLSKNVFPFINGIVNPFSGMTQAADLAKEVRQDIANGNNLGANLYNSITGNDYLWIKPKHPEQQPKPQPTYPVYGPAYPGAVTTNNNQRTVNLNVPVTIHGGNTSSEEEMKRIAQRTFRETFQVLQTQLQ